MSKKVIEIVECLLVNLIVGLMSLKYFITSSNSFSLRVQTLKMPSIYLGHRCGLSA